MSKLVIVESPAKAKTIGKYLGKDYEVTARMGHIRDLPASQLGIDVEHDYAPQYISIKGKEKLIKAQEQGQALGRRHPRDRPGPRGRSHQLASGQYPGPGPPRQQPRDL